MYFFFRLAGMLTLTWAAIVSFMVSRDIVFYVGCCTGFLNVYHLGVLTTRSRFSCRC
jgi:hypothetical protein